MFTCAVKAQKPFLDSQNLAFVNSTKLNFAWDSTYMPRQKRCKYPVLLLVTNLVLLKKLKY